MYTLIYDEHNLAEPFTKVISVHKSRETAEKALQKRMVKLGRRVWDCYAYCMDRKQSQTRRIYGAQSIFHLASGRNNSRR